MLAEDIKGKVTIDFDNGSIKFYVKIDGSKIPWDSLDQTYKLLILSTLSTLTHELAK